MPTKRPRTKATAKPAHPPNLWLWGLGIVGVVLVSFLVGWIMSGQTLALSSATATPPRSLGAVNSCRRLPGFVVTQGFDSRTAALSTSDDRQMGLLLIQPDEFGGQKVYQHPSWDDAGWLGGVALDERGHVYVVPAPRISMYDNPPNDQTKLYRVDTNSGEMSVLMELPAAQPPSQTNPFGLMGLTYDCETQSLYVSSVAGSSRTEEVGRLFRIDLSGNTPVLADQFENVDAIGLGVFNGSRDKRLYFGSARTPEVFSVALDAQGNFSGAPRLDFSLAPYNPRGDDKARRLTFSEGALLRVDALKFNFNLVATSEHLQNQYLYSYDANGDQWVFIEVKPVLKGGN